MVERFLIPALNFVFVGFFLAMGAILSFMLMNILLPILKAAVAFAWQGIKNKWKGLKASKASVTEETDEHCASEASVTEETDEHCASEASA